MLIAWTLLMACTPEPEGPAAWLPLDQDGRTWTYEATPACGCTAMGFTREHTLEVGQPAAIHRAQTCTDCGLLAVSAWLVDAHAEGIEAWGVLTEQGERLYQPPVLLEDGDMTPGDVLSTETLDGLWLSELVAFEPCPGEAVGGECARYQVQRLSGPLLFPAGTWWLAEGVGFVAFTESRGVQEAEWVLVES